MKQTVNERIKLLIESRNESVRAFSFTIGIPQTTLNSIVLNTRKANVEVIEDKNELRSEDERANRQIDEYIRKKNG